MQLIDLNEANIYIDGQSGKKHSHEVISYLRKSLKSNAIHKLRFVDSNLMEGLQVADLVVGSIARSFTNKLDKTEYINEFKKKIKELNKNGSHLSL